MSDTLAEALREAIKQLRVIAGMDLMAASSVAWNAARSAEAALAAYDAKREAALKELADLRQAWDAVSGSAE